MDKADINLPTNNDYDETGVSPLAHVPVSSSSSSSSSFEGYPLQLRHKQDWGRGFILLLLQAAALPESDDDSDVIKPGRVSSSKTFRPRTPCGARCIGHAVRTWSAVCSEASHSQFGEGARTGAPEAGGQGENCRSVF